MAQETIGGDLTAAVDDVVEEMATRREREKKRHKQKMSEIDDAKEEALSDLFDEAGLGPVESRAEDIIEEAKAVSSTISNAKSRVLDVITDNLSGGYKEHRITVKDGGIHKYNKQKNSRYKLKSFVTGRRRSNLEGALRDDAPDVADEVLHALDTMEQKGGSLTPTWKAETDVDVTWVEEKRFEDAEHTFDTLRVSVAAQYRRNGRIRFTLYDSDNRRGHRSGERLYPDKREPKNIKLLGQVADEAVELLDRVSTDIARTHEDWQRVAERVDEDLPEGDDE